MDYTTYNRSIEQVEEKDKVIVRLNEGSGAGVAWVKDMEFSGFDCGCAAMSKAPRGRAARRLGLKSLVQAWLT